MTRDILSNGIAALRGWLRRHTPDVIRYNTAAMRGRQQLRRRRPPTPMTPGEAKIMAIILLILGGLIVYSCGPEAICIAQGGDPAVNAFGAEWCEFDGNRYPSSGDYRLGW